MTCQIDAEKCGACGMCSELCNFDAIKYPPRTGAGYIAPFIDQTLCTGCGSCKEDCPTNAIAFMED